MGTTVPEQARPGRAGRGSLYAVDGELGEIDSAPPAFDLLAEQDVLGGMMFSSENYYDIRDDVREILKRLGRDAFYQPQHGEIYEALCELHDADQPTNPVAVIGQLRLRGSLGRIGQEYILGLPSQTSGAMGAVHSAEVVYDLAMRRRIAAALERARMLERSGEGTSVELSAQVQELIDGALEEAVPDDVAVIDDFYQEVIDDLEKEPESGLVGLPTGFQDLDEMTTGLRKGEYIVVAGRPAMGKSVLATDFLRANAIANGTPTLLFSLEMKKQEVSVRMISAEGKVPLHLLRKKQLDEACWKGVARATARIAGKPVYIDDSPNQSIGAIESKARRYVKRHGVQLIIIDYIQLVEADRPTGDETRDISTVSKRIRALAKSLDVPIVVLAQLNRDGAKPGVDGKVRPPAMTDLKQSGQIEQDAHVIILLHRDDYYEKESPRAGEADFRVEKNRSGPSCIVTVGFQGHYSRFQDMQSQE